MEHMENMEYMEKYMNERKKERKKVVKTVYISLNLV